MNTAVEVSEHAGVHRAQDLQSAVIGEEAAAVIKGIFQTSVIYTSHDNNIYKVDLPLPYTVTVSKNEIQSEFGVTYSERHLRRLIFDLGLLDIINSNKIK